MTVLNHRPKAQGITVRRPDFDPQRIPRYYPANSPILSHLMNALSSTFPLGEQFFVHSVRLVRDRIKNERLQTEISAFIGQEAMHSKAHTDFNDSWRQDDYQLDSTMAWLRREEYRIKQLPARYQLAITCAFEHFTAMLGEYVLMHPELTESFDPEAAKLWLWHAIEESEHKSVAFDAYQAVYGDLKIRRQVMLSITPAFLSLIGNSTARLFWQDRRASIPRVRDNLRGLLIMAKMGITLFPEYLEYFKADFHPAQRDRTQLLDEWRARLSAGQLQHQMPPSKLQAAA
ncbi:MAG: metal-dependent hydrolase [Pseudomonadota bacterium]|nr:metal-dependent hydrolase [Pseudomonadota bacterium]